MIARRLRCLPLCCALIGSTLLVGCLRGERVAVSPEEQRLVDKLLVDDFITIDHYERMPDTQLLEVVTRQGDQLVRYRIDPAQIKLGRRAIILVDPSVRLHTRSDGTLGTGPEGRGLGH